MYIKITDADFQTLKKTAEAASDFLMGEQNAGFAQQFGGVERLKAELVKNIRVYEESCEEGVFPGWQPIETAPWNKVIALKGPSGMMKGDGDTFVVLGYRNKDYRVESWFDIHDDKLSDCGYEPTHWRDKEEVL